MSSPSNRFYITDKDNIVIFENNLIDLTTEQGNMCQPAMCKDKEGKLNIIFMHRHNAIRHLVVEITE